MWNFPHFGSDVGLTLGLNKVPADLVQLVLLPI